MQTTDALIEEMDGSSIYIAESVGFPTGKSPQNAFRSVKV